MYTVIIFTSAFKPATFFFGIDTAAQTSYNMLMDNTEKFTGKADGYDKFRPSYPKELYAFMTRTFGLDRRSRIADIGAGTGKFARPLIEAGMNVTCVEPNRDMLGVLSSRFGMYPNFAYVCAAAEHTTLPPASVDLITAAQAFHWFDRTAFKAECGRVLRPGGKVLLVWNMRSPSALRDELFGTIKAFCPAFNGFTGGINDDPSQFDDFFRGRCDTVSFPNDAVFLSAGEFVGRSMSSSYAPQPGEGAYEAFRDALTDFFVRRSSGGKLTIPTNATAFYGEV